MPVDRLLPPSVLEILWKASFQAEVAMGWKTKAPFLSGMLFSPETDLVFHLR
jgi:hypothetical protein